MLSNIIILVIAHILTLWAFRAWLFSDSFDKVAYTPRLMRTITLRTGLLYVFLGGICCLFELNALILLIMIAVVSFLILALGLLGLDLILGLMITEFYSFLFRWILNFPPEEIWISPIKEYRPTNTQSADLIGKCGLTQSPLRPVGNVNIDNQKYQAVSDSDFIEKGTLVSVIAVKNNNLIVRVHNDE